MVEFLQLKTYIWDSTSRYFDAQSKEKIAAYKLGICVIPIIKMLVWSIKKNRTVDSLAAGMC